MILISLKSHFQEESNDIYFKAVSASPGTTCKYLHLTAGSVGGQIAFWNQILEQMDILNQLDMIDLQPAIILEITFWVGSASPLAQFQSNPKCI
jgi:hypothetical protein